MMLPVRLLLVCLLLCYALPCLAQKAGKLPVCIRYDRETGMRLWGDTGQRVPDSVAAAVLFHGMDSVTIRNIWNGEAVELLPAHEYLSLNSFYLVDTLLLHPGFAAVVYERVRDMDRELLLYTFDPSGRRISVLRIAGYIHAGSYTATDGSRMPWFMEKSACIGTDLQITVTHEEQKKKYLLLRDGRISPAD